MKSIFTFLIAVLPVLALAQLSDGLVIHYNFEGNTNDASGNGNNGQPTNIGFGEDRFGNAGYAGDFTADTAMVVMPDSSLWKYDTLTLSCWFKTSEHGAIIGYQNAPWPTVTNNLVPVGYVDINGYVRGTLWSSTQTITDTVAYNDNSWHHWVLVHDGGTQHMYVDGALAGTKSGSHNQLSMFDNQLGWAWNSGSWAGTAPDFYFDGMLDDFRLYDRALSVAEVDSLYNEENPAPQNTGLFEPTTAIQPAIVAWPNPASGSINLDLSRLGTEVKQVALVNSVGQTVAIQRSAYNRIDFNIEALQAGVYTIVATTNSQQSVARIVIQ